MNFLITALFLLAPLAQARVTNQSTTDADTFCSGPSGKEVCFDKNGHVVPTTDAAQDLGTSGLRFLNIYTSGNASIAGNVTVGGTINATGGISTSSYTVYTSSYIGYQRGDRAIPVVAAYITMISTDPTVPIYMTAHPAIATGTILNADGTCCDTLNGSQEFATGTFVILGSTQTLGASQISPFQISSNAQDPGIATYGECFFGYDPGNIPENELMFSCAYVYNASIHRWILLNDNPY